MKKYLFAIALFATVLALTSCACKEHTYTEWEETFAATCTEAGTETRGCENCEYTEERAIEAFEHSFGEAAPVNGTSCTEPYDLASTCSVCSAVQTETVQPTGHVYDKENEELRFIFLNPSCMFEGVVDYKCVVCKSPYSEDILQESIPTIDHRWVSDGCEGSYYCSMCYTKGAPAPGHDWSQYGYMCSRCGLVMGLGKGG